MQNLSNPTLSNFGFLLVFSLIFLSCEEEIKLSPPEVITGEITAATSSSAKVSGQIVLDGNTPILESGVVYGKTADPTISDTKVVSAAKSGSFSVDLTGLDFATTYHIRVFATNKVGTSYGLNKSFNTEAVLPTVKTTVVSDIKSKTALSGGEVLSDGGSTIIAKGVCWNTSPNPTTSNNKTSEGVGVGNFTSPISNLTFLTKYYVRSYATNSIGTAYGDEIIFTTLNPIYLDPNGVTIKAYDWATIGEKGIVSGEEYLIVDKNELKNIISSGGNPTKVCTSKITDMSDLFRNSNFNGDLNHWDVRNVTNMISMFSDAKKFNGKINLWDVANVRFMQNMFFGASSFNQTLKDWDVSNVTDMTWMFGGAAAYNQDMNTWNVGNVTDMRNMFSSAFSFNGDISSWNVSKVTNMSYMFFYNSFNRDINQWNVSSVNDMTEMFRYNTIFNRDLSLWDVSKVLKCSLFGDGTNNWTLPKPNFTKCNPY